MTGASAQLPSFVTVGNAVVAVATTTGGYLYRCSGCGVQSGRADALAGIRLEANEHAWQCRATPDLLQRETAELARDLLVDLRAEQPQLDARAAAGMALSAAILIGLVGQTPTQQPVYTFSIISAGLLTVACLLFFSALLPSPFERRVQRRRSVPEGGEAGIGQVVLGDRDAYHVTRAGHLLVVIHSKHRRLALALWLSGLALVTAACGAGSALLLGF